jgi:hypothetical protein
VKDEVGAEAQHLEAGDVGDADRTAAGERMIGCDHEEERFGEEPPDVEIGALHRQLAQDHVMRAVEQFLAQLPGHALADVEAEVGEGLVELSDHARQEIGPEARARAEADGARETAAHGGRDVEDLLRVVERAPGERQDLAADRRERHRAASAFDELDSEKRLEVADLEAERRLADPSASAARRKWRVSASARSSGAGGWRAGRTSAAPANRKVLSKFACLSILSRAPARYLHRVVRISLRASPGPAPCSTGQGSGAKRW